MSKQNSTFVINDGFCVKDEIESFSSTNSSLLGLVKEEITTFQSNNDNNKPYHVEE